MAKGGTAGASFRLLQKLLDQLKTTITTTSEVPKGTAEIRLNPDDFKEYVDAAKTGGIVHSIATVGLRATVSRWATAFKMKESKDPVLEENLGKLTPMEQTIKNMEVVLDKLTSMEKIIKDICGGGGTGNKDPPNPSDPNVGARNKGNNGE